MSDRRLCGLGRFFIFRFSFKLIFGATQSACIGATFFTGFSSSFLRAAQTNGLTLVKSRLLCGTAAFVMRAGRSGIQRAVCHAFAQGL